MAPDLELTDGVVIAGYRVVRPLSQGGMGAVYLVEQIATKKQRALKVMLPELVDDEKLRERFTQEAQIGAGIESEHVVEVIDAGIDPARGVPWLAMELLKGETLTALVRRKGPLGRGLVREVMAQLCHALGSAHDLGIVHRDLKPDNVFLESPRRDGVPFTVKILDFGIATLVSEARTHFTGAIGTPLFMAPEQMTPGSAIAPATDIWALGLMVFWMLTGHTYWEAGNVREATPMMLLNEVSNRPIVPASQRAAELGVSDRLPASFDAWFERAVVRAIDGRFENARKAKNALDPLLEGAPAAEYTPPAPRPPSVDDPSLPTDAWIERNARAESGDASGEVVHEETTRKESDAKRALAFEPTDLDVPPQASATAVGVGGTAPTPRRSGASPRFVAGVAAIVVAGVATTLWLYGRGAPTSDSASAASVVAIASATTPVAQPAPSASPREPTVGLRALEMATHPTSSDSSELASEAFWQSAARDFDAAIGDPPSADASLRWRAGQRFARAGVALATGKNDEAIVELRAAADIDKTWALPHASLASALASDKKFDEAREEARLAERLEPGWAGAVAAAARVEAQAGRLDEAILEYRRAIAEEPKSPVLVSQLALTYHAQRNDVEAARLAKEALALDPDVVDVRVLLAERALEQHDGNEALLQASRAAGVEPNHTAALLSVADALAMTGKKAEALDAYRKALAAWKQHGPQGAPEDRLALVEDAVAKNKLPPPRTPAANAAAASTDAAPTAPRSRPSPDDFSNLGF